MNAYVIPAFKMAWPKIQSVLIHAGLAILSIIFVIIEQAIAGHNFGSYQALAMIINTTISTYVYKYFTAHGVVVSN